MRRTIAILSLVSALALCSSAQAHPGHAVEPSEPNTIAHYATHPDHLAWWIVLAVVMLIAYWVSRNLLRKPAPAYARVRKD